MTKTVLFDLDGTLVDSIPFHLKAFKKAYLEVLKGKVNSISDEEARKKLMKPISFLLLELEEKHGIKIEKNDFRERKRKYLFELIKGKNLLFPEAKTVVKSLKKRHRLAIVTSSPRITVNELISREFESLFETTVTFDDVANHKPFPDPFLLAAKRLKVKPKECFTVGDSLFDVRAAKSAGMKAIAVPTGLSTEKELLNEKPWRIIHSLQELKPILLE
jgi:HAD superfamily hydrolase (TIGR01509 family)